MAVVASCALGGLTACRAEPSVAAYVGDSRITESRVQAIWDDARAKLTAEARTAAQAGGTGTATMPISRADIVSVLVGRNLITKVAEKHGVTMPAGLTYDNVASVVGLPATTEYVHLFTEYNALQDAVKQAETGTAALSDEDWQDVLQRLSENGTVDAGTTVESLRSTLPDTVTTQLQSAIAVRDEVTAVAGTQSIQINPRYAPLEIGVYPIRNSETSPLYQLVVAPLGEDTAVPVDDVS
ncbi:hypothetical protein [Actinoplanes sp. NPDC051851]|uniref:hypothetical protein n=1 Tax=Actinoplanes sp. NPDC051851 TaxID=3154753 RepID=UPI00342153B3